MGMGSIDIALWDFAGKYRDAPIHEMLGTYRSRIPAYTSTYLGDRNGGRDSPAAYGDFAAECLDRGYEGFKIHVWGGDWRDTDHVVEIGRTDDVLERMRTPTRLE